MVVFYIGMYINPSVDNCPQLHLRQLSTLRLDIHADIKKQPCDNFKYIYIYI